MSQIMRKDNFESTYMYFIIIIVSLFLINETPRMMIYHKFFSSLDNVALVNFLYIISAAILLTKSIVNGKVNKKVIFISFTLFGMMMMQNFFSGKGIINSILIVACIIIPLTFTSVRINKLVVIKVVNIFLNVLNVTIVVLLVLGIVDYIFKGAIQMYMANNFAYGEWKQLIIGEHLSGVYRYYSFLGHPLYNANLFLIFFSFNSIYNKYCETKISGYKLTIITILGLILSGSKTALILGAFLIVFCSDIKKHKWLYYIVLAVVLAVLFNSKLFQQNLMQRFIVGINNKDFSSGRNDLVKALIAGKYEMPAIFVGGGSGYSRVISISVGYGALNFEYPLIMLAYDYGVFSTILIFAIIFVYPVTVLLKNKNYYILMNFIVQFLYINGNNGLANFSDYMAEFCFIELLMINLSMYLKNSNLISKDVKTLYIGEGGC